MKAPWSPRHPLPLHPVTPHRCLYRTSQAGWAGRAPAAPPQMRYGAEGRTWGWGRWARPLWMEPGNQQGTGTKEGGSRVFPLDRWLPSCMTCGQWKLPRRSLRSMCGSR